MYNIYFLLGSPFRYEHQKGYESKSNHGEFGFEQRVKPEGRIQRFYPTPSKAVKHTFLKRFLKNKIL